jgi:hypothetical protein
MSSGLVDDKAFGCSALIRPTRFQTELGLDDAGFADDEVAALTPEVTACPPA